MRTVLMDLQGTLGGDPIGDITDFEFYPNVLKGLKLLQDENYRLVVVTNQSKISKNIITISNYEAKKSNLFKEAKENGIDNLEFYCCPHSKSVRCTCRKPNIGLFDEANKIKKIDIEKSYMIGDMRMFDMLFAHNIGLKKILVLTGVGEGSLNEFRHTWQGIETDYIAEDFFEAAIWIKENSRETG